MSPPGSDPASDDADCAGTDVATDPTRAERPLAAVRDAAVERALVDDDGAARHLALAGGLERARRVAAEGDDPRRAGLFAPALLAVTTLAAFDADESGGDPYGPDGPADPPASPTGTASPRRPAVAPTPADAPAEAVVDGAALAVRRFDVDVRRAAALADVSVATLGRRIESASERR